MRNAYTATATIACESGALTVQFDYEALAAIRTEMKAEEVFGIVASGDLDAFCSLLAIGLRRHHPDMTAAKVKELSPPLALAQDAVNDALLYAHFGPDGPPAAAQSDGDADGDGDGDALAGETAEKKQ